MDHADDLPNACFRGIRHEDWVNKEGEVKTKAFVPNPATANKRDDRGSETSINFEDDDRAIRTTLEDTENAKYGAIYLTLGAIEDVSSVLGGVSLSYERNKLKNNPYHGNIIYAYGLRKNEINYLAGGLAIRSRPFEPAENETRTVVSEEQAVEVEPSR